MHSRRAGGVARRSIRRGTALVRVEEKAESDVEVLKRGRQPVVRIRHGIRGLDQQGRSDRDRDLHAEREVEARTGEAA